MVNGLAKFAEAFRPFQSQYVLIGGSACDWIGERVGAVFRQTKDLDLVVCAETVTPEFGAAFWRFVREGGYKPYFRSDGTRCLYRFVEPTSTSHPAMLELFSRAELPVPRDGATVAPLPLGDDVSDLSAILLEPDYYGFIRSQRRDIDGVSTLGPEALIVLKAHAWMDLRRRHAAGQFVKERDLRKHRQDVFRLLRIVVPGSQPLPLPASLFHDLEDFLVTMESEPYDLAHLGIRDPYPDVLARIRSRFVLEEGQDGEAPA